MECEAAQRDMTFFLPDDIGELVERLNRDGDRWLVGNPNRDEGEGYLLARQSAATIMALAAEVERLSHQQRSAWPTALRIEAGIILVLLVAALLVAVRSCLPM